MRLLLLGGATAAALAGTAAGTSAATATLTAAAALSGTAAGTSSATGTLSAAAALSGTAAGTSSASGTPTIPTASAALSGQAAGTSSASGTLTAAATLSGQASGTSSASATPSIPTPSAALAGVAAGTSSATGTLLAGPVAADLVEAIQAYLTTLLAGQVRWVGAGELPPGLDLPFVAIGDLEETSDYQEDGSAHPPYDDEGELTIRVVATTRQAAKALSWTASAGLTRAPLTFQDGLLLSILRTSRGAPAREPEPGPNGEEIWVAHLMFETITSKNL